MAWLYLLIAGFFEVVWAVALKYSHSFTKMAPSVVTVGGMILSIIFLGLAVRVLPLGTAYAVWTGIGTLGTVLYGVLFFGETITVFKAVAFAFIILGVVGLKLSS